MHKSSFIKLENSAAYFLKSDSLQAENEKTLSWKLSPIHTCSYVVSQSILLKTQGRRAGVIIIVVVRWFFNLFFAALHGPKLFLLLKLTW